MTNLLCLDSNGVLTGQETLAERLTRGRYPQAADDFRRYSSGALPLPKGDGLYALARRVAATHKGISAAEMEEAAKGICPTDGARAFVRRAKELGYEVAVVSADYAVAAGAVGRQLGVPRVHGNVPCFENDIHKGELVDPIIIGEGKAAVVRQLKEELQPGRVVAVADSPVDAPMLREADIGVFCGRFTESDRYQMRGSTEVLALHFVGSVEEAAQFL